jgi:Tol biopolymer transport system component
MKPLTGSGEPRKLTDLSNNPHRMVWSPDSQQLAFVGSRQIYTVRPDGSDVRQVTTEPSGYLLHSWSPDGQTIAYRADLMLNPFGVDTYEFYVADLASGEPDQILDLAFDADILWR